MFYNGKRSVLGKRIEKIKRRKSKASQRAKKKYHDYSKRGELSQAYDTYEKGYDDDDEDDDEGYDDDDDDDDEDYDDDDDDDEDYDDDDDDDDDDNVDDHDKSASGSTPNSVTGRVFDNLSFPCRFTMKVIGVNSPRFPDEVLDVIQNVTGSQHREYSAKMHGKYCSVTVSPEVDNADHVYECYRRLKGNCDVKFIL